MYDQSSSVGESDADRASEDYVDDENDEAVEDLPAEDAAKIPRLGQTTKQMSKQVGGIASHKSPVLALDRYILKPLKLDGDARDGGTTATAANVHGESMKGEDYTKKFRGVREVAFYEAMQFASSLPSDLDSRHLAEVPNVRNGGSLDGRDRGGVLDGRAALYLLSLSEAGSTTATGWPIRSCRHPCAGHHRRVRGPSTALAKIDSMMSYLRRCFDAASLVAAYYVEDPVVASGVRSYERAWRALIGEMCALRRLHSFTSPYYGVVDSEGLGRDRSAPPRRRSMQMPHLLLQNLTTPFRQPNIIDIKMGTRTFEPTAPLSKQISEAAKYPQQDEFGFRIVGMCVHLPSSDGSKYKYWDKSFGVSLKTKEDLTRALTTFFQCEEETRGGGRICHVLSCLVEQLTQIKDWFETGNSSLAFYASSILIAYEGNRHIDIAFQTSNEPVMKIIDFAHVCRQTGPDEGYLKGVCTLLEILNEIKSNQLSNRSD
ncbi:hypothetical protein ACHAW5_007066 [Stephanodiscus triporus]|uniref:Kinase n=1 Tax=Stephanodiscus triporus TaxID=2934178 RepID=A0ABD3Q0P0_9STRA